jgi:outer membrane protein assembly factor BamE (lipoprotein component of BamABCDE complex)
MSALTLFSETPETIGAECPACGKVLRLHMGFLVESANKEDNEPMKKLGIMIALAVMCLILASGCSVYMAAKQPDQKNLDILAVGTPRNLVLAEMGQPMSTEEKDGKITDVFSFVQGYSKGAKTGRAVFHGLADIFTLGLWEAVGTPTEAVFDGDKMAYEVKYDTDKKVEKATALVKRDDQDQPGTSQPPNQTEQQSP